MKIYNDIADLLTDIGVKAPVKNKNFFVFKIEDYFGSREFSIGPYKHSFFELTFGSGHDVDCKVGTLAFKPLQDTLSFASPYQMSSWKINSFEENSLGFMIFFNPELLGLTLDRIEFYKKYPFLNLNTTPVIFLNDNQRKTIVDIMQHLTREYDCLEPRQDDGILAAYLSVLLEKIKQFYSDVDSVKGFYSRAAEIAFLFENLLKEEVDYKKKIAAYANDLNISSSYLAEAVKETTGKTALTIIQDYIILKAKGYLRQSNQTIETIAYELGFEDASNFIKYFKRNTGITPSAFRKLP